MKYRAAIGVLLLPLCSQASDEKLYRELIQHSLNQQSLCLGETQWPVAIIAGSDSWINAKMEALDDAGLVTSRIKTGKKIWSLTAYGRASFTKHHDLCYGRMRIRSINSVSKNNSDLIDVTFTYYIQALPDWAKNKSVRVANTDVDNLVMGVDKVRYQAFFKRDSQGALRLIGEPEQLDLLY